MLKQNNFFELVLFLWLTKHKRSEGGVICELCPSGRVIFINQCYRRLTTVGDRKAKGFMEFVSL